MLRFFRILTILTIFALALPLQLIAKEQFTIIIDPGHGGGDYGTPHRKCKQDEKTIALNVALKLGKLIEKNYSDVKVVYTRKTDKYPSLPERTQIAKKNNTTVEKLKRLNGIKGNTIRAGKKLKVK